MLLGNYSTSYPSIVDTGSVCLTLPAEIYDSFAAHLNLSSNSSVNIQGQSITRYHNIAIDRLTVTIDLPPLTFSTSQAQLDQFYLPLESLLLPPSAFEKEQGAPYVRIGTQLQRLCVLRGDGVSSSSNFIAIGTLALHSLYFAADFSNNAVGLASKLSVMEVSSLADRLASGSARCRARVSCKGDETYNPELNTCTSPSCDRYYFTKLEESTGRCVYSETAYGFGIAFVLAVSLMEMLSYFTLQYSAYEAIRSTSGETASYAASRIDPITRKIGKYATMAVDFVILHVFNWVESAHTAIAQDNQQQDHDQNVIN
jgi:hypothetical protein